MPRVYQKKKKAYYLFMHYVNISLFYIMSFPDKMLI